MTAQDIRNICLLGHGGSGKTSLVEQLLFSTGCTERCGRIADGSTVCDYDAEEIRRKISLSLALAPISYRGLRLNLLDTPGNFDFAGEVVSGLRAADCAVLVCGAKEKLSVGAERSWKLLGKKPRMLFISRIDEENSNYPVALEALQAKFGAVLAPLVLPVLDGSKRVTTIVDILHQVAYTVQNGKTVSCPIPAELLDEVETMRAELMENAASTDEALMETFLETGELGQEELLRGVQLGVKDGTLVPVLCGSSFTGLGIEMLLQCLAELAPVFTDLPAETTVEGTLTNGSPVALVFKTVSDQYGKYSLVKVLSGKLTADMSLLNANTGAVEKLGRLYTMRGKKVEEVKELCCGAIGAIAKMERVRTGDTLCDPKKMVKLSPMGYAEPCYSRAMLPKVRGQEEKMGTGLLRLREEDPTFSVVNNAETRQVVVSGAGDMQIDVLVSKLKSRFGVEVALEVPRVPYREKIRKTVRKQGRHKKQTGGSGQFGDVHIVFEPQTEKEEVIFAEAVFGGSVPKNFFPAVEKGIREACLHGVLAGYPVVFLKATLVDGSYHPVDSSEIAFKTAAQLAYKAALPEASPVLLEPIGSLKVLIPESYMGDVIGDLNKRRGHVLGMTPDTDGYTLVEAEVPMAEMSSYAIDLRSMSQSRGTFTFRFVRYEDCPPAAQEKAIAAAKAMRAENNEATK